MERCVLDMDHYCPWMNNCVGYRNYRYFILYLIYMVVGCVFAIVFIIMGSIVLTANERLSSPSTCVILFVYAVVCTYSSVCRVGEVTPIGLQVIYFSAEPLSSWFSAHTEYFGRGVRLHLGSELPFPPLADSQKINPFLLIYG